MQIDFPIDLHICDDLALDRCALEKLHKLLSVKFVLITGSSVSLAYAQNLLSNISAEPSLVFSGFLNTVDYSYVVDSEIRKNVPEVILAIGGGSVADFAKRVAYISGKKLILLPTIIANDGLISPIAVLRESGSSVSLPGKMPDHVFIDLVSLKQAPKKYIRAAACDLLSNISATSDWEYAADKGSERLNNLAFHFSRMAAYNILDCKSWDHNSPEFFRSVLHGQVMSAMAMAYAGSSRPCSGSEHLIAHAMDALQLTNDMLHGEVVGRATLFSLYLQGHEFNDVKRLLKMLSVPHKLLNYPISQEVLMNIFEKCRSVRPGRKTVLDEFTEVELVGKYREFENLEG